MNEGYTRKRDRPGKAGRVLSIIAVVLIAVTVFGVIASVSNNNIGAGGGFGGNNNVVTPEPDPIVPTPPLAAPFGGTTIFSEDFSAPDATAKKGSQVMNGNKYNLIYNASYVSTSFDQALSVSYNYDDESLGQEFHVNFYPLVNGEKINYDDVSYVMYDFDINAEEFYDTFYIKALYDSMPATRVNDIEFEPSVYTYSDGRISLTLLSYAGNNDRWINTDGTIHVTLIYRHDLADHSNTVCYMYVDGNFAGTSSLITKTDTTAITSLRIGVSSARNLNTAGTLSIDNISINVFDAGYEGAISDLFDDTSILLQDCSDSILFTGEYAE